MNWEGVIFFSLTGYCSHCFLAIGGFSHPLFICNATKTTHHCKSNRLNLENKAVSSSVCKWIIIFFVLYHSNFLCNRDNQQMLIRAHHSFQNRSINIIMDDCYNEMLIRILYSFLNLLSQLGLENTPTASLQKGKTHHLPPTGVLHMTLNNLIVRFQY